jgi:hypothetical protein
MAGMVIESTRIASFPEPAVPARSPELAAIASYCRAGRCALFVGAGLSVGAGLPAWDGLMGEVVRRATPYAVDPAPFREQGESITVVDDRRKAWDDPLSRAVRAEIGDATFGRLCRAAQHAPARRLSADDILGALETVRRDAFERAELEKLRKSSRAQDVFARCRDILGRERFFAVIREALTPRKPLPATHADVVRTPFSCVVTTNVDNLLERAYAEFGGGQVPPAPTGFELDRHGTLLLHRAFFILKAHGDLARPESMVFTADDYRRVIHANPAFQAVMDGVLMTHAVVFVGYSLGDVNFRLLLDAQLTRFRGRVPPRFAVMEGVGASECELLWRTAKIRVLPYPAGKHAEVGAFLSALARTTSPTTAASPPAQSAKAPRRLPGFVRTKPAIATLAVASDGARIDFDLTLRDARGAERSLWTGRSGWEAWTTAREAVAATQRPWTSVSGARATALRAVAAVSRLAPPELGRKLAALPPSCLVELATTSATEPVPWEWILVGRTPLALRSPVVRRPVDISPAARGLRRGGSSPLRALVVGDAGSGDGRGSLPIPMADREADAVGQILARPKVGAAITRLSGPGATAEHFVRTLEEGEYDVVHFAGHAWANRDDAYLVFWDRVVLGSEITPALTRRPPLLLVMSTHHTAFFPLDLDRDAEMTPDRLAAPDRGEEPAEDRGFTSLAMRCGVASFVGCCGSVSDAGAAAVMADFYERLVAGATTADSLRAARKRTLASGDATGLFFACSGVPDFRLAAPSIRLKDASMSGGPGASPAHSPRARRSASTSRTARPDRETTSGR